MRKLLLLALLLPLMAISQEFSGTATYSSLTKLDIEFDSTRFTPDQIRNMKQMMQQQLNKEYTLKFNRTESIFEEVEVLETGQGGRGMGFMTMMAGGAGSKVYKNLAEKYQAEQVEFFGKIFLIGDSLTLADWKLGKETKQIGSYTCYKATTTREVITRKMSTEAESVVDTLAIEVTAWYTPQIPMSHGPDIYWGLPGLIMEVSTDKTTILCTRIELKQEKMAIEKPTKGEAVTRDQYTEMMEAKLVEMEKMRGGQGGGGRGSMEIRLTR